MSTVAHPASESRALRDRVAAAFAPRRASLRARAWARSTCGRQLPPAGAGRVGSRPPVGRLVQVGLARGSPGAIRGSARASADPAVYVGIFMIVMGAGEAGYYTREDGPSGDDFTGS